MGAEHAYGVDVEPDAIPAAQENAETNGVADQIDISLGSVDEIMAGVFEIQQASLVLANIIVPILKRLLDDGMGDLIAPEGVMMLSGILEEQMDEMAGKIKEHNLHILEKRQIEDWVALAVKAEFAPTEH